jgi:hypothetical protein
MKEKNYLSISVIIYVNTITIIACNGEKMKVSEVVAPEEVIREEVSALPDTFISPADNPLLKKK